MIRIARALLILAALAPWLILTPLAGSAFASVLLSALTLLAAFHGWGIALAIAADRPTSPAPLRACWGVAAVIALAGVAIALGVYGQVVQSSVLFGGAAIHSTALVWRHGDRVTALANTLRAPRHWLAPIALLLAIGVIVVLGAAGDLGAYPFDDETHLVAQIARLVETGALADPIGYARTNQLGGSIGLAALTSVVGDLHVARMSDALGFVLLFGIGCARLRWSDDSSGVWATLMIVFGAAFAISPVDASPLWIPAALIVSVFDTLDDDDHRARRAIPLALIAGALVVIRGEYVPIALAALVGAWWQQRRPWRADLVRIGTLALVTLAVVLPYALARHAAWSSVADGVHALIEPARLPFPLRLVLFTVATAMLVPLVSLALRDKTPQTRWFAILVAAGFAGIISTLSGELGYAMRTAWPIAIAAFAFVATTLLRAGRMLSPATAIVTLLACLSIADARIAPASTRLGARFERLVANLGYLRHVESVAPYRVPYDRLLASVPIGATVGVWVGRPELLPYATHRILDLRTPRVNKLRVHRWDTSNRSKLARLVDAIRIRYLLVEADVVTAARRDRDPLYAAICPETPWLDDACNDDLAALAAQYPIVAESDGVVLVELRR